MAVADRLVPEGDVFSGSCSQVISILYFSERVMATVNYGRHLHTYSALFVQH